MADFLRNLQDGLHRCGIRGGRVLVAVSGGADSVALFRGLHSLAAAEGLDLIVAHLNHQLRGDRSDADAAWLEALCRSLDVPLILERQDIAKAAHERGAGIEETARSVRYAFLQRTAFAQNCRDITVAHTADDQAETILHHIVRGTGLEGLRGMPLSRELDDASTNVGRVAGPDRPILLTRPLLNIRRKEIESYLSEIGQSFCTDESNIDERYTRNRVRHSLLPLLERDYNPRVREALLSLGRQAEQLQDVVQSLSRELLARALEDKNASMVRLNCERLAEAPRHLVRECFVLLWRELGWPRQKMGFDELELLADLVVGDGSKNLPGQIEATRRGSLLILRKNESHGGAQ